MISMSKVNAIRRTRREGKAVAETARAVGVCRDTVYKYLREQDLSPKTPVARPRKSKLDPYRPPIESWPDEDRERWREPSLGTLGDTLSLWFPGLTLANGTSQVAPAHARARALRKGLLLHCGTARVPGIWRVPYNLRPVSRASENNRFWPVSCPYVEC